MIFIVRKFKLFLQSSKLNKLMKKINLKIATYFLLTILNNFIFYMYDSKYYKCSLYKVFEILQQLKIGCYLF